MSGPWPDTVKIARLLSVHETALHDHKRAIQAFMEFFLDELAGTKTHCRQRLCKYTREDLRQTCINRLKAQAPILPQVFFMYFRKTAAFLRIRIPDLQACQDGMAAVLSASRISLRERQAGS